jgi:hypothetical protein
MSWIKQWWRRWREPQPETTLDIYRKMLGTPCPPKGTR